MACMVCQLSSTIQAGQAQLCTGSFCRHARRVCSQEVSERTPTIACPVVVKMHAAVNQPQVLPGAVMEELCTNGQTGVSMAHNTSEKVTKDKHRCNPVPALSSHDFLLAPRIMPLVGLPVGFRDDICCLLRGHKPCSKAQVWVIGIHL